MLVSLSSRQIVVELLAIVCSMILSSKCVATVVGGRVVFESIMICAIAMFLVFATMCDICMFVVNFVNERFNAAVMHLSRAHAIQMVRAQQFQI